MHTIGIDLGTTNTVAAANAGVLPLRSPDRPTPILPSVVAYLPSGETLVGAPARERRAFDPKNTIYSAKRVIGKRWHSYGAREFCSNYPFEFVHTEADGIAFKTRAGVRTPVQVATEILTHLCKRTEIVPSETEAVVSVPATFGESERAATLVAMREVGFMRVRSIVEPVATALAYLDRNATRYAAVYDLGGGTFDLAIIQCDMETPHVVASGGDPYLGGDDVDRALASFVAERVLCDHGWDVRGATDVFERLTAEAERAKIELTGADSAQVHPAAIDAAAPSDLPPVTIDRAVLVEIGASLLQRTFGVCDEVLDRASLEVGDIQAVFLAGGATLLPGVREQVAKYFGRKLRFELNPMHVVSLGASMAAARPRHARVLSE
jgi:molecular chaperone DnaK